MRQQLEKTIQDYEILQRLGEGSYGTAYKVRDKRGGDILVMKQIPFKDYEDLEGKLMECQIMQKIRHPYICRLKHHFQDKKLLCIIFEYCDKGDLNIYLKNQNGMNMTETRVKRFIIEITLAIDYLHQQEIIHRDLKPSNIFLKGKDYTVQIGDFGTCSTFEGQTMIEDVGTLQYQSPEILDDPNGISGEGYDQRTDIWSLGCIIFQLCNFDVPFTASGERQLIEKIKQTKHRSINSCYSQEIKDIYEICMNKDYLSRPSAADILKLDFVQKWAKDLNVMNHQLLKYSRDKCERKTIQQFLECCKESSQKYCSQSPTRLKTCNAMNSVYSSIVFEQQSLCSNQTRYPSKIEYQNKSNSPSPVRNLKNTSRFGINRIRNASRGQLNMHSGETALESQNSQLKQPPVQQKLDHLRNKSRGPSVKNNSPIEFENKMQFINFTNFQSNPNTDYQSNSDYYQGDKKKTMRKRNSKHMMQYTNVSKETCMATEEEDTLLIESRNTSSQHKKERNSSSVHKRTRKKIQMQNLICPGKVVQEQPTNDFVLRNQRLQTANLQVPKPMGTVRNQACIKLQLNLPQSVGKSNALSPLNNAGNNIEIRKKSVAITPSGYNQNLNKLKMQQLFQIEPSPKSLNTTESPSKSQSQSQSPTKIMRDGSSAFAGRRLRPLNFTETINIQTNSDESQNISRNTQRNEEILRKTSIQSNNPGQHGGSSCRSNNIEFNLSFDKHSHFEDDSITTKEYSISPHKRKRFIITPLAQKTPTQSANPSKQKIESNKKIVFNPSQIIFSHTKAQMNSLNASSQPSQNLEIHQPRIGSPSKIISINNKQQIKNAIFMRTGNINSKMSNIPDIPEEESPLLSRQNMQKSFESKSFVMNKINSNASSGSTAFNSNQNYEKMKSIIQAGFKKQQMVKSALIK